VKTKYNNIILLYLIQFLNKVIFQENFQGILTYLLTKRKNKIKKRTKKLNEGNWNELCSFLAESNPSETVFWKTVKGIESGNTSADFDPLPTTKKPNRNVEKILRILRKYIPE
jgi:hypothetical protein